VNASRMETEERFLAMSFAGKPLKQNVMTYAITVFAYACVWSHT
jgi:hypothetical protein